MAEWKVPISASLVLTMLLACLHRAYGYPSGAPSSACSSLTPGHMNSSSGQPIAPQTLQSPYVIKVQPTKYTPGQVITVTIESSIGFRGILLQARKGTTPVGTWQVAADYKHLNCNHSGDSLTHVDSSLKAGRAQFSWTAPSTLTGTVKIMATFALAREIFWTGQFASIADGAEQVSGGCATEPCVNGLCFQGSGNSYVCDCNSGFEGSSCTDKIHSPYCQDGSLCGVGGTCFQQSNPVSSYRCVCETGYSGIDCMTKVTCNDNPCINGGTCFNRHAGVGYFCDCPSDFTGTNCEVPATPPPVNTTPMPSQPCESGPCRNGGTCQNVGASYRCDCPTGYQGQTCETIATPPPVNTTPMPSLPCESGPCRNGGTCQNVGASYRCDCPTGYRGQTCETIVDCSASNPCDNGGTCDADGRCTCPSGVTGNRCQTTVNTCVEGTTCKNGGSCSGSSNKTCECPLGYTGDTCDNKVPNHCENNPCKNGGTCLNREEQFSCACKPGYTGQTCTSTTIDPNKNGQTGLSLEIWWIALIALIGLLLIIIVIAVLFTVCRSSQPDEAHIVGNRKEYP